MLVVVAPRVDHAIYFRPERWPSADLGGATSPGNYPSRTRRPGRGGEWLFVVFDVGKPRRVVIEEEPGDELAARAGPGLAENCLQVVLNGVRRKVQPPGDLARREAPSDQLGDPAFADGEAVGVGDQWGELGRPD